MSAIDVDVLVLGGGVAGLAAATSAAKTGAGVLLVEPEALGGRAAASTLVPWRALERAVDAGGDRGAIWERAQAAAARVTEEWRERSALRLEDHGVERVRGAARLRGPREAAIEGGPVVRFEGVVIATGGAPRAIGEGPRVLRPGQLLSVAAPPPSILVVGGGVAGAELASALSRVPGTEVSWLMDELGLLPDFDRELAETLGDVLMGRGVKLVHGKRVLGVEGDEREARAALDGGRTYAASCALVAVGTRPRTDDLGLDTIGLEGLSVDARCETAVEGVFAAGDCTPRCRSAGAAEAMGRIAGRRAAGEDAPAWDPARVPETVCARPALAQIGLTPERAAGREVALYTLRAEETLDGALSGVGASLDDKGFTRIVCDADTGHVLGASAAGPGALAAIDAIGLAMELGARDVDLRRLTGRSPGPLEAIRRAVD